MYNELIDALRYCADGDNDCGDACPFYDKQPSCSMYDTMIDAADAIERLTADVDRKDKALQAWVKIWEQTKDKLIRRICSHCDSVLVGCEGCPVVGEVRAVFDEQQT